MLKVLFLEDDELFANSLIDFLSLHEYQIEWVKNGKDAVDKSRGANFDLYLLDIKVPLIDGFSFLELVRKEGDLTPAIFITSYQNKDSLLKGFRSGCDDYLKKPFDLDELLLRIQAVIKRYKSDQIELLKIDKNATLNLTNHILLVNNTSYKLSPQECELLKILVLNKNRLVTKDEIYEQIWSGKESDGALRVYISRLKNMIGEEKIENIRGMGYLLKV